jgi:hypothetical protein
MVIYPVVGGWQAQDPDRHIACFGRSEDEAREALAAALLRADELLRQFRLAITKAMPAD